MDLLEFSDPDLSRSVGRPSHFPFPIFPHWRLRPGYCPVVSSFTNPSMTCGSLWRASQLRPHTRMMVAIRTHGKRWKTLRSFRDVSSQLFDLCRRRHQILTSRKFVVPRESEAALHVDLWPLSDWNTLVDLFSSGFFNPTPPPLLQYVEQND